MYQQHPPRRPGPSVAALVSIGAAIVILTVALVIVAVAFSRSPEAAGWDSQTAQACEQVRGSRGGLDGKGADAIRAAAASDVVELRQAAARYTDEAEPNALDMRESVLRIARWCKENGLN